MNPTTSAAAKVCVVCGQDCSTRPRTKDPQGRYTCKECFDRLAAKRAPAPAANPATAKPVARPAAPPQPRQFEEAPDDAAVMAGLMKDVPVSTENCPSCGAGLLPGASICTICGYNKETGKTMGVKTLRAPKEKRVRSGPAFSLTPGTAFVIALVLFGAPAAMFLASPELGIVGYALSSLFGLILSIATIVVGFRLSPVSGVLLIVTLFVPLVNLIYWLYFIFVRNEDGRLKGAWAGALLGSVATVGAMLATMSPSELG